MCACQCTCTCNTGTASVKTYTIYSGKQVAETAELRELREQLRAACDEYDRLDAVAKDALGRKIRLQDRVARAEWDLMPVETRPMQYWRAFDRVDTGYWFGGLS